MRWPAVPLLLCGALSACGGGNAASKLAKEPAYAPAGQAKCDVVKSQAEPLVVEWPPAERGRLEAALRTGLVAVHYAGCEMELRPYCRVRGASYEYAPVTRKRDEVTIRDEDDLYAQLPAGAVRLEGKLKSSGELHVDMTLVGRWESKRGTFARTELEGDCDDATHIVAAVTVGSFTFSAGAQADVSAGGKVLGIGAGGSSTAKREMLSQDGDATSCAQATGKDTTPPDGCGALLRIEVVRVGQRATTRVATRVETPHAAPPLEPVPVDEPPAVSRPPVRTYVPAPQAVRSRPPQTNAVGGAGRGPLGQVVGWTALGSLGVGTVLAVVAAGTVNKYVGNSASASDCSSMYHYCDATALSAKGTTQTEALFADGFLGLGIIAGVVYYFLPAAPQVTASTVRGGGAVGLGGRF